MAEHDDIPFDDDDERYDDIEIGAGYADGKTSAQIADEQSFPEVPDGRHEFFLKRVDFKTDEDGRPQPNVFTSYTLDDSNEATIQETFAAYDTTWTWAMVDNPDLTVREFYKVPVPGDDDSAHIMATSAMKKGKDAKIGLDYNRLRHTLAALGHETEDGSLPDSARTPRDWKFWEDDERRIVTANVIPQRNPDKSIKCGPNGKPYKQLGMFSQQQSEDTMARLGHTPPGGDSKAELDVDPGPPPEPEPKPAPKAVPKAAPKAAAPKAAPKAAQRPAPKTTSPKDGKSPLKGSQF